MIMSKSKTTGRIYLVVRYDKPDLYYDTITDCTLSFGVHPDFADKRPKFIYEFKNNLSYKNQLRFHRLTFYIPSDLETTLI